MIAKKLRLDFVDGTFLDEIKLYRGGSRPSDKTGFYLLEMAGEPFLFFGEEGRGYLVLKAKYFDDKTSQKVDDVAIGQIAAGFLLD